MAETGGEERGAERQNRPRRWRKKRAVTNRNLMIQIKESMMTSMLICTLIGWIAE